jgi:hypothetical protein
MRTGFVVVIGFAALGAAPVRAQDTQVRVSGRVQVQYNTTSVGEAEVGDPATLSIAATTFETRRVRLGVRLTIDEWITGMLEPEYALGSLSLRQVWMNLGIDPAFELRIGQFKKPFSLIQLTSSLETSAIERGLRIREIEGAWAEADEAVPGNVLVGFGGDAILGEEQYLLDQFGYMGYELGAAAHGEIGQVSYEVGVFNGTGADARDRNDAKSYAGRLTWAAPTETPIAVGAGVSYHEFATASAAPAVDGTAFEVDFELGDFRRDGLHVIAEATTGDNMATDESFLAAQAMASWFRPTRGRVEGIEPLLRLGWGDPDREVDGDAAMLLTPGVSLYFAGRTRLQLNWDFFVPQGDRFETQHALRAQAQLAF